MNPTFENMLNEARTELADCYDQGGVTLKTMIRIRDLRLKMINFLFDSGEIPKPVSHSKEYHEFQHFVQGCNNLRKMLDLKAKRA